MTVCQISLVGQWAVLCCMVGLITVTEVQRQNETLRKQRIKPQVSAVFRSVSIDLYAQSINPQSFLIFVGEKLA